MPIVGSLMGFFFLSGLPAQGMLSVPAPSLVSEPAKAPAAPVLPAYIVALTAYNAVAAQTDNDPLTTASGAYSNPEIIAARSQDMAKELPFGTIIAIEGPQKQQNCGYDVVAPFIGYRIVADTMNSRYEKRIDILFDTDANYRDTEGRIKNASSVLGVCKNARIRVVGYIDSVRKFPKTQAALAQLVNGVDVLAVK